MIEAGDVVTIRRTGPGDEALIGTRVTVTEVSGMSVFFLYQGREVCFVRSNFGDSPCPRQSVGFVL